MNLLLDVKEIYSKNIIADKPFFEKKQWTKLAEKYSLSEKNFLFSLLHYSQSFACAPLSQYKVGAVGLGKSGKIYLGSNIEFTQFPLNQSIHAEQCLTSLALAHGEKGFDAIYISAFPCGHCRQFLREMNNFDELKIYVSQDKTKTFSLTQLLPHSFGPQDLNVTESLFEKKNKKNILIDNIKNNHTLDINLISALKKSFCPYSQNSSGLVFYFKNSSPILGSSIESCAYNPTLSSFHMAYSQVIMKQRDINLITEVYFIEAKNTLISYEKITKQLVSHIAPKSKFKSFVF